MSKLYNFYERRILTPIMENLHARKLILSDAFPEPEAFVSSSNSVFKVEDLEKFQIAFPDLAQQVKHGSLVLCDSYTSAENPDFHKLSFSLLGRPHTGIDREPLTYGFSLANNAPKVVVSGAKAYDFPMQEAGLSEFQKIESHQKAQLINGFSLPLPERVAG